MTAEDAARTAAPDPLVGTVIDGRYRVTERLAAGGMGAVYLAQQTSLGRDVALKVIRPGLLDHAFRERFEREARATSTLRDPHVVTVHDFGIDGELPFLVFEKLEGRVLADAIAQDGRMPWPRAARVLRGVAAALAAAHKAGVVHRDLKPSNVFLVDTAAERDFAKVIDFGIAKALDAPRGASPTEQGAVPGTPGYIAPERLVGQEADARSDLYSLGVLAWDLIVGRGPYVAGSAVELAIAQLQHETPRLADHAEVPAALDALVHALVDKDPACRPPSAAHVIDALDALLAQPAAPAPAPAPAHGRVARAQPGSRRAVVVWGVALSAVVVGWLALRMRPEAPVMRQLDDVHTVAGEVGIERDPALSRDGKRLAFVAPGVGGLPDVFVVDLPGGAPINLTRSDARAEATPSFAPDGDTIAFCARDVDGLSLWLVPAAGGALRALPGVAGAAPVFTPDGDALVYAASAVDDPRRLPAAAEGGLWRVDLRSEKRERVIDAASLRAFQPALSPSGARAAVLALDDAGRRDIHLILLDARRSVALTADDAIDHSPVFVDEDHVVFLSTRGGEEAPWIVRVSDDGADAAPTPWLLGAAAMTQLAVAGQTVAFVSRAVTSALEKRRVDLARGTASAPERVLELPRELRALDVSPDEAQLVMESAASEDDVLLVSADGSARRALTKDAAFDRTPRFLPDLSIVLASNRGGAYGLWTSTFGGTLLPLPGARCPVNAPAPAPDGARIAAHLIGCDALALFDLRARTVRELSPPGLERAVPLSWLDDHTLILNDDGALVLLDVDQGTARRIEGAFGMAVPAGDGRLLAFHGRDIVLVTPEGERAIGVSLEDADEASFAFARASSTLWTTRTSVSADVRVGTLAR